MQIKDILAEISYEIDGVLASDEDGALPHELFLNWCVDLIIAAGEADDVIPASHEQRGRAVHGYSYSDYDGRLDLFITNYKNANEEYPLYQHQYDAVINRLDNFFSRYYGKSENDLELADPAYDLVETIQKAEINLVRYFLLTDGRCTVQRTEDRLSASTTIQTHIWDINRFLRHRSSEEIVEDTDIVVRDYGLEELPCSSFDELSENKKLKTYLCVFPGDFLADSYKELSSRLLERNVRAFLGFSPINRGIRDTIENSPENFMAFNNGLTCTARNVILNENGTGIKEIEALQIVNGGQTTNAIFKSKYAHGLDLSKVFVPVKLCVLAETEADDLAPEIAKYANKQNVVRNTDYASNNPAYRALEQVSRSLLAPAAVGSNTETKWFFERARGQYKEELASRKTKTQKSAFEKEFPRKQKFDKGKLAKCWGCWYQQVEEVSLGPERYHARFVEDFGKNKNKFDSNKPEISFKRLTAMIILWDAAYSKIRSEGLGFSYPGNVTDYTVAVISNLSQMRLDLDEVWQQQAAPDDFLADVVVVGRKVGVTIKNLCEQYGMIPRELCKGRKANKLTLWQYLSEEKIDVSTGRGVLKQKPKTNPEETAKADANIQIILDSGSDQIWALAAWAKETNNLHSWQRGIAGTVAKQMSLGRPPSEKQAKQLVKALSEAKELGFTF